MHDKKMPRHKNLLRPRKGELIDKRNSLRYIK